MYRFGKTTRPSPMSMPIIACTRAATFGKALACLLDGVTLTKRGTLERDLVVVLDRRAGVLDVRLGARGRGAVDEDAGDRDVVVDDGGAVALRGLVRRVAAFEGHDVPLLDGDVRVRRPE